MPKEEWGTKRVCPTTGKRFYDLNKSPIVSPYTGEIVEFDESKNRMIAADAEDASAKKGNDDVEDDGVLGDDDVDVGRGFQGAIFSLDPPRSFPYTAPHGRCSPCQMGP